VAKREAGVTRRRNPLGGVSDCSVKFAGRYVRFLSKNSRLLNYQRFGPWARSSRMSKERIKAEQRVTPCHPASSLDCGAAHRLTQVKAAERFYFNN